MKIKPVFIRVFKTWLIGVITYWITKKLFPEKKMVEPIFLDLPYSTYMAVNKLIATNLAAYCHI
jgi:hypothetical protein